MPGQPLTATAFVLGRQASGSDKFEQLTAFSAEHGTLLCLHRLSTKAATSTTPLDLFDEAELTLESSSQGRTWFIKEHRHVQRYPGIGRSYDALRTAAALATLLSRNPIADESRVGVVALLRQTLASLESGARPDLVWLKSLFVFLRDEGYPVKQQWWQQLATDDRTAAAQILNQPLAGQNPEPAIVSRLVALLQDWVAADTEIRLR